MADPAVPSSSNDGGDPAGTPAAAGAAEEMTPQQRERQLVVDAYKASLMKNRAAETRVKELRLANMDLDKESGKARQLEALSCDMAKALYDRQREET